MRYPRGGEGRYTDSLMQAENVIREGTDVTIVCYGTMINEVAQCRRRASESGHFGRDNKARHDRAKQL